MAIVIGTEARIKHVQAVRDGHSNIFEGLDFWAPNINIFRDPRWGRGQETYGEDPFLTARLGVAFVTGMQGDDPNYYRVISTPKHFAVHSGPEPTRHTADVKVSRHDELDTYLPAFRATVTEGRAASVMCAYNSINGQPACANEFLLQDQLRGKWKFQGYVVSDCEAVVNIFRDHHFTSTQRSVRACTAPRHGQRVRGFRKGARRPRLQTVSGCLQQGILKEREIDTALMRLFTARMKLGMFDPPELVPYSKIDERGTGQQAASRDGAYTRKRSDGAAEERRYAAVEQRRNQKIAVVGPLADQTRYLLGNYTGTPTHVVSVLDGLKAEFPAAQIAFVPGTQFLRDEGEPGPGVCADEPQGQPGLTEEFSSGETFGDRRVPYWRHGKWPRLN